MGEQELKNQMHQAATAAAHEHASADTEASLMQDLQMRVADLERRMARHDEYLHKHG